MPRRTTTTVTPEATTPEDTVALRAEARTLTTSTVTTAAASRATVGDTGRMVALRQNLSPRATPAERRAHLLACMVEAGVLTPEGEPGEAARLSDTLVVGILSKGQARTIVGMAGGLSYTGLAEASGVNVGTVKKHLAYAYDDDHLGVGSYPEAVIAAVRTGAVPLGVILAAATPEDTLTQQARLDALYDAARAAGRSGAVVATPAREARATCAQEGCRKRANLSPEGFCPDHAEG